MLDALMLMCKSIIKFNIGLPILDRSNENGRIGSSAALQVCSPFTKVDKIFLRSNRNFRFYSVFLGSSQPVPVPIFSPLIDNTVSQIFKKVHNTPASPLLHPRHRPRVDRQREVDHMYPGDAKEPVFQASIFNIFQEGPDDSWNIPPNVINTYCYIMWVNSKIFLKGKLSQVYVHPPQAACRGRHRRECGGTGGGRLQSKVCHINCSLFSKCAKLTPLWKVILCGTKITEFNQSNSLTSY